MIERLKTLVQMQKLDDEIGRCRDLQQVLPRELHALIEDVENATNRVAEVQAVIEGIQKRQKELDEQTKHNTGLINKYKTQQAEIKTNKEYKALNSEIASLTAKNSEIESQTLELMDTADELKARLEAEFAELHAAEKRHADKASDLEAQIAELEGTIERIRNARNDLARTLPVPLIKQYGALIKSKSNQAVAYANNGACGGCGFIIRPQIRIELELLKKVINCENCGRILMVRIAEPQEETEVETEE